MNVPLLLVVVLLAFAGGAEALRPCAGYQGVQRTAMLVADVGTFSGTGEDKFFLQNLNVSYRTPTSATVCTSKTFGTIMQQKVVVVTTGIGPVTAALCMTELLQCRRFITSAVFMGTSGFSAQKGGVLQGNSHGPNKSTKVLRIGDICISPYAVNWDCQQADWTQECGGYPNVNSYPAYNYDPTASFLYGQCIFTSVNKADVSLTNDVAAAANTNLAFFNQPERTPRVLLNEAIYFDNMTLGTKIKYKGYKERIAPASIYTYHDGCIEIDGQFFFSGLPWEMLARNFSGEALNQARNTTRFAQANTIPANAEEGVGITFAIQQYNYINPKTPFIYTLVRANSDWLHNPVYPVADGTWRQIEQTRDFSTGYAYAIASGSNVVLSWLQTKCYAQVLAGTLPGPVTATCGFSIEYTGP